MSKAKRVTARQENGDDGYCYVVRVDGLPKWNGLTRREADHYKWVERRRLNLDPVTEKPIVIDPSNGTVSNASESAEEGEHCYVFPIYVEGWGKTPQEAWEDWKDNFDLRDFARSMPSEHRIDHEKERF